jgi:hypothetical protein
MKLGRSPVRYKLRIIQVILILCVQTRLEFHQSSAIRHFLILKEENNILPRQYDSVPSSLLALGTAD